MYQDITDYIWELLKTEYNLPDIALPESTPPSPDMWDIAVWVFPLARELKKPPHDIAAELVAMISQDTQKPETIGSLNADGPYINIFLNTDTVSKAFWKYMQEGIYIEKSNTPETIVVDYIGANVGKPLHIGHICTPLQGQMYINLATHLWHRVISDSHIGDWGIIFWKLIVAFQKYGNEQKLEEDAVEHLFELYVKISEEAEKHTELDNEFRQAFGKLSEWDPEMIAFWQKITFASIASGKELLSKLSVIPEYNIGESFYEGLSLPKYEDYPDLQDSMHDIVQELVQTWVATANDDGSVGVEFDEALGLPSTMLQKRDGTHGYFASDLASIKYRMQSWAPDKIIYFVDVRQKLHFQQAFEVARMAGWLERDGKKPTELFHAYNGFISLKTGAMSTRKGNIIKLQELLAESENRAEAIMRAKRPNISESLLQKNTAIIWVWAIQYGYLKKSRETDSVFDWDEYMSFDGNSGPYIQYSYVRAKKILTESGIQPDFRNIQFTTSHETQLAQAIWGFSKVVVEAFERYANHLVVQYMYQLTRTFSWFYTNVSILSEPDKQLKNSRLALLAGYMQTIETACEIVGMQLPDEM